MSPDLGYTSNMAGAGVGGSGSGESGLFAGIAEVSGSRDGLGGVLGKVEGDFLTPPPPGGGHLDGMSTGKKITMHRGNEFGADGGGAAIGGGGSLFGTDSLSSVPSAEARAAVASRGDAEHGAGFVGQTRGVFGDGGSSLPKPLAGGGGSSSSGTVGSSSGLGGSCVREGEGGSLFGIDEVSMTDDFSSGTSPFGRQQQRHSGSAAARVKTTALQTHVGDGVGAKTSQYGDADDNAGGRGGGGSLFGDSVDVNMSDDFSLGRGGVSAPNKNTSGTCGSGRGSLFDQDDIDDIFASPAVAGAGMGAAGQAVAGGRSEVNYSPPGGGGGGNGGGLPSSLFERGGEFSIDSGDEDGGNIFGGGGGGVSGGGITGRGGAGDVSASFLSALGNAEFGGGGGDGGGETDGTAVGGHHQEGMVDVRL